MPSRRPLLYLFSIPPLVYIVLILILAVAQKQLIYHPHKASSEQLTSLAARQGLEPWLASDGSLIGWKTSDADSAPSAGNIVVFHGNSGFALHRDYFPTAFRALSETKAWNVYLFEYPGYGSRPGKPSEETILPAARNALDSIISQYPDSKLILVGESLGSGVATQLAASFPNMVTGLILVTPYTSLVDVAACHYSYFPVRLFLRERYDSLQALRHYHGPAAFLLAENDEVVPASLGRRLHDSYHGPKHLRIEAGRQHNTLPYHPHAIWWQEFIHFLLQGTSINSP